MLAAYGAGIQIHIEDLADHIAGNECSKIEAEERWKNLFPPYQRLAAGISS